MTTNLAAEPNALNTCVQRLYRPTHDYRSPIGLARPAGVLLLIGLLSSGFAVWAAFACRHRIRTVADYDALVPWSVTLWVMQAALLIATFVLAVAWGVRVSHNVGAFGLAPSRGSSGLAALVRTCRFRTVDEARRSATPECTAWIVTLIAIGLALTATFGVVVTEGERKHRPVARQLPTVRNWLTTVAIAEMLLALSAALWLLIVIRVTAVQVRRAAIRDVDLAGLPVAVPVDVTPSEEPPSEPVFRSAHWQAVVARTTFGVLAAAALLTILISVGTASGLHDTGDYEHAIVAVQISFGTTCALLAIALIAWGVWRERLSGNHRALHDNQSLYLLSRLWTGNDDKISSPLSWIVPWSKVCGSMLMIAGFRHAIEPATSVQDFRRPVPAAEFADLSGWLVLGSCGSALVAIGCIVSMQIVAEATGYQEGERAATVHR